MGTITAPKKKGQALSVLQSAFGEYAAHQVGYFGRTLEDVLEQLRGQGAPDLKLEDLREWMRITQRAAAAEGLGEDPFAGEEEEEKREQALEDRYRMAAECVPGAAEILGVDRLCSAVGAAADFIPAGPGSGPVRAEAGAEVVSKCLDFLVPEISAERYQIVARDIVVPRGGHHVLWLQDPIPGAPRESIVLRSTVVLYDAQDELVALHNFTRPRGRIRDRRRSTLLPVMQAQLIVRADLRAVAQRLVQVALEFRPGRHAVLSQKQVGALCERTKQAVSAQRGVIAKRVLLATDGRAGFRGLRNLKSASARKKAGSPPHTSL